MTAKAQVQSQVTRLLSHSAEGSWSHTKALCSSTAVSDKGSWRVCAGASLGQHVPRPINGCHLIVAEAPCLHRAGCGAVMGNLYQYAMRKSSLSGCQTCHGQSFGSIRGVLA